MTVRLTLICAWFNRPEAIARTVQSVLTQSLSEFKFVVINDGSTEPKVRTVFDRYNDPRLIVHHQSNLGFTETIVRAAQEVDTEYFCVVGAGDEVASGKSLRQMEFLDRQPSFGAVGCGHQLVSARTGKVLSMIPPAEKIDAASLSVQVPFTHGTVMYRTAAYRAVGGYDPFFKFCQDHDLYRRLQISFKMGALSESLYEKYIFPDGATFSPAKNIAQLFYSRLAREQDRQLIEYYRLNPDAVAKVTDPLSFRQFPHCVRRAAGMYLKGEREIAGDWMRLAGQQAVNLFRLWKPA